MSTKKKKKLFGRLEVLFVGIVPLALIVARYCTIAPSKSALTFQISITGIILIMLVFLILKKTVLKKRIKKYEAQAVQLETMLNTESDQTKLGYIEEELRAIGTFNAVLTAIMPLLFLLAVYVVCIALEAALIKLNGVLGFIILSYVVGSIFGVLEARQVEGKHKEGKSEE